MFAKRDLVPQLNEALGDEFVTGVKAHYQGIYQWTINLYLPEESQLQLKFGPSAWYANERDDYWEIKPEPGTVDYAHLFLTRTATRELRPSAVTLQEVLDGLGHEDHRLRDEILDLLGVDDRPNREH